MNEQYFLLYVTGNQTAEELEYLDEQRATTQLCSPIEVTFPNSETSQLPNNDFDIPPPALYNETGVISSPFALPEPEISESPHPPPLAPVDRFVESLRSSTGSPSIPEYAKMDEFTFKKPTIHKS